MDQYWPGKGSLGDFSHMSPRGAALKETFRPATQGGQYDRIVGVLFWCFSSAPPQKETVRALTIRISRSHNDHWKSWLLINYPTYLSLSTLSYEVRGQGTRARRRRRRRRGRRGRRRREVRELQPGAPHPKYRFLHPKYCQGPQRAGRVHTRWQVCKLAAWVWLTRR